MRLGLIREVDGRDLARRQGATTTTAWLRDRYRLSGGTAARQVRLAAALHGGLPKTVEALAAGTVNLEQAQVIAAAVPTLPGHVRAEGEEFLVGQCAVFGPRELGRLTSRLLDVVAPQVAERQAAQQFGPGRGPCPRRPVPVSDRRAGPGEGAVDRVAGSGVRRRGPGGDRPVVRTPTGR
ncbi:DUF222 domain-containing protein [Rugosimonospora acidiphila]|uniref:DUF222 domain-containing protein n=1 Tax=Rugosimonospora acidiphila TaxID=556531 RepID=UPI0031E4F12B